MVTKSKKVHAKGIPEGLKNLKELAPLPTTVDDGILIHDFVINVLNVHPEDVYLLATEAVANRIIRHVRVGDEESKDKEFYEEAESDAQRKTWLSKPYKNVTEHVLPLIKASFLCYSKGIQNKLLERVEKRIILAFMRKDPTLENYQDLLNKFAAKAK